MGRVLSGVQPTGHLHLGNYLGALKQWTRMQEEHECLFCIVDLHAITTSVNPKSLRESSYVTLAAYIAAGIDPNKSAIFCQSAIAAHSELAWILGCMTPNGWLSRMTQFKEKAGKHKENASLGLFGYPVLMAADILLYKATHVPVGDDQKQHLELTRDIAQVFNRNIAEEYFPIVEPFIGKQASRVMSLRDGKKKMSKSEESDYSRINLVDDADMIALKIKKAKTDAIEGISYDVEMRPEASNLITIYAALSDQTIGDVVTQYQQSDFAALKKDLAELMIATIVPMGNEMQKLLDDKEYLTSLLQVGTNQAQALADQHIEEIKYRMGFITQTR